jgi:NADH-quinone oxidoreductase subunit C
VITLSSKELALKINELFPKSIVAICDGGIQITCENLADIARFLHDDPTLALDYLTNLTAIDYKSYFEIVYHIYSLKYQHQITLKIHSSDRNNTNLPSVTEIWRGADYQEREIYDLFGIRFEGHHNLKRIMLWEGFKGHPLRKDFNLDAEN